MKIKVDKCKVLDIGNNNQYTQNAMDGSKFSKVNHEKDSGITISNDLKPRKHCSDVVKKANKLVGFIRRIFEFKFEKKIILLILNKLVRPYLEYCIQFWSSYYRRNIDKLERIQTIVTKIIPRLRNVGYERT